MSRGTVLASCERVVASVMQAAGAPMRPLLVVLALVAPRCDAPPSPERCDGRDDDGDGNVDDADAVDAPAWYRDADGDGYGDATASVSRCAQPAGYVKDATDPDDTRADVPGGTPSTWR